MTTAVFTSSFFVKLLFAIFLLPFFFGFVDSITLRYLMMYYSSSLLFMNPSKTQNKIRKPKNLMSKYITHMRMIP